MAIIETLKAAQGGAAFAELGKANGLSAAQAAAVIAAVVPELTRAFERNTLSRGGLADVVQALGQGHHRAYLENPALYKHPGAIADGNGILEHLVGSKDASRGIADRASQATGVDSAVIRGMLPVVAGMTMGGLSKEVQGAFGDILGRMGLPMPNGGGVSSGGGFGIPDVSRLPGGGGGAGLPMGNDQPPERQSRNPGGSGGWGGDVRSAPGGGLEMPDTIPRDGGQGGWDGGGRGRAGGQFPFPMPQGGGDNPYGDLSDILRRGMGLPGGGGGPARPAGGGQMGGGNGLPFPMPGGGGGGIQLPGGAVGGGLLWNIVRSVLGGALGGFQSQGMLGWIIKAVVMRYGWSILRALLGRGFGGR